MKKKIFILIPSMAGGGAERVLVNLLNLIDYERYELTLCVVIGGGVFLEKVHPAVKKIVLFRDTILTRAIFYAYRNINFGFLFKIILKNATNCDHYDVGVSFIESIYSDLLLLFGSRIDKKITVVHSSYNSYALVAKNSEGRYRERILSRLSKFDTIVAVSHESLSEFVNRFGEQNSMQVIYNPLNKEEIINNARLFDPDFPGGNINLVAVGRLVPVKGYDRLIRVCHLLKEGGFKFKLRILGEGSERTYLSNLINQLFLNDFVELLGFVDNPYPYLMKSDIFVMSSESEGLPTVLCEAMVLGKPVVVTNCSGCREIIDNGNYGIITEQSDNAFFEGIVALIDDVNLRNKFSKASFERSKLFDDEIAIAKYCRLFDSVD